MVKQYLERKRNPKIEEIIMSLAWRIDTVMEWCNKKELWATNKLTRAMQDRASYDLNFSQGEIINGMKAANIFQVKARINRYYLPCPRLYIAYHITTKLCQLLLLVFLFCFTLNCSKFLAFLLFNESTYACGFVS